MPASFSAGTPAWVDAVPMTAQSPFRVYGVGTKVYTGGTAAAVQIPGGVFPGLGAMAVTATGGMSVTVSAGYCCVPNSSSALQGGYIFGLLNSHALTVAAADPASPRIDLVCAYVQDLGTSASAAYVQVITGNPGGSPVAPAAPANSITLASVAVAAGVTSVTFAMITDKRAWVVAPGGILPIPTASAAPAAPATQFMYTLDTNQLVQGTGSAGTVALPSVLPWVPQTSVKTSNTLAGSGGALVTVLSASVTTDGSTDIEVYLKWGAVQGSAQFLTISAAIDGTVLNSLQVVSAAGTSYGTAGGSAHFYTSAAQANTPSAATHTVTMRFQAGGTGTSTSDGILASASSAVILRVAPVSV